MAIIGRLMSRTGGPARAVRLVPTQRHAATSGVGWIARVRSADPSSGHIALTGVGSKSFRVTVDPTAWRWGRFAPGRLVHILPCLAGGSDPVPPLPDWTALAAARDSAAFGDAVVAFSKWARMEVAILLSPSSSAALKQWLDNVLGPQIAAIRSANSIAAFDENNVDGRIHDARNELVTLYILIDHVLDGAQHAEQQLRTFLAPPSRSLVGVVQVLAAAHADRGRVVCAGLEPFSVTAGVREESLRRLLDNVVRNAMAHPAQGEKFVTVEFRLEGNRLTIADNGAGMDQETVSYLRQGVRIHDGRPVDSGDRGLSWTNIRELCAELHMGWAIHSAPGKGTMVVFTLPTNFLDIDPAWFQVRDYFEGDAPEQIATFTPEAKLTVVGQLFDLMDRFHQRLIRDLQIWQTITDSEEADTKMTRVEKEWAWMSTRYGMVHQALSADLPPPADSLMARLLSSVTHVKSSIASLLKTLAEGRTLPNFDANSWIGKIADAAVQERHLLGGDGYRGSLSRWELSSFASDLMRGAAAVNWVGDHLVIEHPPGWEFGREALPRYRGVPRLPDPEHLVFRTILGILGWTMRVETRADKIVIALDFGAHRIGP